LDGVLIAYATVGAGPALLVAQPISHLGLEWEEPRELVAAMDPPPPADVMEAARNLNYRDFLTVALILYQADVFPDQWIYGRFPLPSR
jgi:hypothetical protein